MNRATTETRCRVIACLIEGNSIRATSRLTGVAINTVIKLAIDAGEARVVSPAMAWIETDTLNP
jgi:transposase-like protein